MPVTRKPNQLRPTRIEVFPSGAPGSVMITQGNTRVLCTASLDEVPKWMISNDPSKPAKGWVTAEYAMLPGSTSQRKKRGPDGRATEIQRLIGRTLRAAVDLAKMPGVAIACDCDVISADGGTRTAAITGAYVALAQCLRVAQERGEIAASPLRGHVAAVSVGIIDGVPRLDLDYELDVRAEVDMNVAMNERGQFVEVQGTAEGATFSRKELDKLLALAAGGIRELIRVQKRALGKPQ